jgi:hypothetical protein
LEDARERKKLATKDEDAAKAELLEMIGTAATAIGPDNLTVTAKSFDKPAYVVKVQTQRPIRVKRGKTNGRQG